MIESDQVLNPSDQLAQTILKKMLEKSLIAEDDASKIGSKIAEGKMQESDWKLVFEKSLGLHKKSYQEPNNVETT